MKGKFYKIEGWKNDHIIEKHAEVIRERKLAEFLENFLIVYRIRGYFRPIVS